MTGSPWRPRWASGPDCYNPTTHEIQRASQLKSQNQRNKSQLNNSIKHDKYYIQTPEKHDLIKISKQWFRNMGGKDSVYLFYNLSTNKKKTLTNYKCKAGASA